MKFLAALLALFLITPAFAGPELGTHKFDISGTTDRVLVGDDFGGSIKEYIEKYTAMRRAEAKVAIDGWCISACTFILGEMPTSSVCVTKFAWFGFHSAANQFGEFSGPGTRLIWFMYPTIVQDMLRAKGWDGSGDDEHPDLVLIKGTDLYPLCSDEKTP